MGGTGSVGSFKEDTGRGLTGQVNIQENVDSPYGVFMVSSNLRHNVSGSVPGAGHLTFDASRVWGAVHTAAEFAPIHTWQPVAVYLGAHA